MYTNPLNFNKEDIALIKQLEFTFVFEKKCRAFSVVFPNSPEYRQTSRHHFITSTKAQLNNTIDDKSHYS